MLSNACNYLFKFPDGSKVNDKLYFRVNKASRAEVYFTITNGNLTVGTQISTGKVVTGTRYNLSYPEQAYVSVISTNMVAMDYNIYLWGVSAYVAPAATN